MIGITWLNRSCIVASRLNRDWVYYSGWILYEGGKKNPLSSQCLRIKWQDTSGHAIPSSSSSFLFSSTKTKTKYADSQVWLKNCEWQVLIGRFGSVPLPSRVLSSFFFLFFSFLLLFSYVFFLLSHTHTLVKFLWRIDLVLHLQCNWHPESNTYYYNMFTHVFFVQQYQRGARQKWFTPREREKKTVKKKKKKYKYLCPAVTLHKWKKDWHWIQKYHNFYISNCLCWLLFRNTLISQESLSAERISIFNLLVFTVLITTCSSKLSNALCITANMTCPGRFSVFVIFFWWTFLFFSFFFTLQNYNSIHIFSSLNSCF